MIVQKIEGQWRRATGVQEIEGVRIDLGKVERLVASEVWGEPELSAYGLRIAVPFVVPEGEQLVGEPSYDEVGDDIVETYETEPIPPQPYRIYKSQFIARMTEVEAETLETVLAGADAKLRLLFNSVEYFVSDDPLFATLHATVAMALDDEARANELLEAY